MVVKPSGPHHRDRCRTRVNASNTSSRGAPITREITISRSSVACAGSPPLLVIAIWCSLLPCLLQLLHVLLQPIEALAPEPLEAADPLVDRKQPTGVQAVQPLLARPAYPHEPDLPEDPQMLGRLRLGHPQVPRHVGHRPHAAPQQHQDLPPPRFGDRVERVRGRRRSCHDTIICLYQHVSTPGAAGGAPCPALRYRGRTRFGTANRALLVGARGSSVDVSPCQIRRWRGRRRKAQPAAAATTRTTSSGESGRRDATMTSARAH